MLGSYTRVFTVAQLAWAPSLHENRPSDGKYSHFVMTAFTQDDHLTHLTAGDGDVSLFLVSIDQFR